MRACDVVSFTCGLYIDQLSGIFVGRRDIFSPGTDLVCAAPRLALVDNDGIVCEERDECVEVARNLGGKVAGDDVWGRVDHDWSFHLSGGHCWLVAITD